MFHLFPHFSRGHPKATPRPSKAKGLPKPLPSAFRRELPTPGPGHRWKIHRHKHHLVCEQWRPLKCAQIELILILIHVYIYRCTHIFAYIYICIHTLLIYIYIYIHTTYNIYNYNMYIYIYIHKLLVINSLIYKLCHGYYTAYIRTL